MSLKIGDLAPTFVLLTDEKKSLSLRDLRGKKIILYFYPKDNTPGCTREACDFRDNLAILKKQGVEVIGISKDTTEKHQKFKEKYQLPFTLLTDPNGDVCIAYEVMSQKSLFGRSFLGIQRSTFVIDGNGIIRAIWRKVKVNNHIQEILDELQHHETK
jgi:peroxiredoxin Q/BCP